MGLFTVGSVQAIFINQTMEICLRKLQTFENYKYKWQFTQKLQIQQEVYN
jgi:hypothetical protein